jgi:hypothetical protein
MDPSHYEKIADRLMQFRGKIPKAYYLSDKHAQSIVDNMQELIDHMLNEIDQLARMDDLGLIQ